MSRPRLSNPPFPVLPLQAMTDHRVNKKRNFWLKIVWASAAGVLLPIGLGFFCTMVGMAGAFTEVSQGAKSDSDALAEHIRFSLVTTAWGIGVSIPAFIILVAA